MNSGIVAGIVLGPMAPFSQIIPTKVIANSSIRIFPGPQCKYHGHGHGHGACIESLSLVGLGVPPQTSSIRSPAQFERRVTQPKLDDMPPHSSQPAAKVLGGATDTLCTLLNKITLLCSGCNYNQRSSSTNRKITYTCSDCLV